MYGGDTVSPVQDSSLYECPLLFFGMFPVYVVSLDDEELARSREERPMMWRFVLCSLLAGVAHVTALAFSCIISCGPVQVVGGIERRFTWRENVNAVTVYGCDGSELYTLSGHCYVGDSGRFVDGRDKFMDGRSHPGQAVVTCYDGGVPYRLRILEGASFTVENAGAPMAGGASCNYP